MKEKNNGIKLYNMNILDNITRVGRNLMISKPFYGLFLSTLNKTITDKIPTAGVGKNGINTQLYVNPKFWSELNDVQKEGLLLHEILHICFDHITQRSKYLDKDFYNIAADCYINQIIGKENLPEGGVDLNTLNQKHGLNMKPNEGSDYYYDELMRLPRDKQEQIKSSYGAGNMHMTWEEFDKLSDAEKKLIRKQVEYQLKEAARNIKNRGTIPGELSSLLDAILNPDPPKFDWKSYLRRFAGASNKIFTKKLRRKINKRFPDMPGLKIKQKKHILVAIDTSGSVSDEELKEFMNEIHHIWKTGTQVTLAHCDAYLHKVEEFKGLNRWEGKVFGRGGTEFTPVIEYLNKYKDRFGCLIYMTDGEGSTSIVPIKKTLWVHSSKSNVNNELPGFKIKLN
jgi:predicted metal-dependent peptidase